MATIVTRSGKGSPLTHAEVDANFTNLNTDKLELSGGTMTGNLSFGDNDKAIFGAGSDLQIYHDGTDSIIKESGGGDLQLWGDDIRLMSADGTETMLRGNPDAQIQLYYNNALKLATTSTGVDITGTLTSDGLTVQTAQGDISIPTTGSSLNFARSGTNYLRATDASGNFMFITGANDFTTKRLHIANNGDISFYEDTGTTAKFFWDASAEHLGVGTASPAVAFHVDDNSSGEQARISSSSTSGTTLGFRSTSTNGRNYRIGSNFVTGQGEFSIYDDTANAERMRIDSSGNLLVGTTSTPATLLSATSGGGMAFDGTNDYLVVAREGAGSGYPVLRLNQTGVDGEILEFRKDGSTVGSIGNSGGDVYIGTGVSGLFFIDNDPSITPHNTSTNAANDSAIDIGRSSRRFKDLYLSGGVYLGGTGSANKLDDYETGTFTPELINVTVSYSSRGGNYTKIGRLVYCDVYFNVSSLDTTDGSGIHIAGLPFTARTGTGAVLGSLGQTSTLLGSKATLNLGFGNESGGANIFLFEPNANSNYVTYSEIASSGQLNLCLMYYTN